jgi:RNA polymerase sigma factor (sigma-70 family)
MSPSSLRRYRAERLLRHDFDRLRGSVLASVRGRLRARGVSLDRGDLEACYAQAWQGLYLAVVEGQEIASPAGWLVMVTHRRAIDEHRGRARARCQGDPLTPAAGAARGAASEPPGGVERDLATELDDRARLRALFEALRARLNARERQAATLCYLQGLSRSEAARHMGVSDARMRKLMEGRGPGRPGVARKVGALVETIREGAWCEEQASSMRALAYGVLDPEGERYRLALQHRTRCPACRAYVVSLRGLAVALPPVLPPWAFGAAILARARNGAHTGGLGALSASGAAGAGGAAGGGWLAGAGPLAAKLAVGCLLALGIGADCVVMHGADRGRALPRRAVAGRAHRLAPGAWSPAVDHHADAAIASPRAASPRPVARSPTSANAEARSSREFGLERSPTSGVAAATTTSRLRPPIARSAESGAEREFAPG